MELELGLAPPSVAGGELSSVSSSSSDSRARGKRGFGEAFQQAAAAAAATLPLFDDGSPPPCRVTSSSGTTANDKKPLLVGWPPVSSARSRARGATHVKVKKEGDAIGRKVDLSLHASYDDLLATLRRMFPTTAATNQGMYVAKLFRASPIIIQAKQPTLLLLCISDPSPYHVYTHGVVQTTRKSAAPPAAMWWSPTRMGKGTGCSLETCHGSKFIIP
jgi:auxin-responsive protein IAA